MVTQNIFRAQRRKRWVCFFLSMSFAALARGVTLSCAKTGISARLSEATGEYRIASRNPSWTFSGSLGSEALDVRTSANRDRIGAYQEMTFAWRSGKTPLRGSIRLYQDRPVILFGFAYGEAASPPSAAFPSFTEMPANLYRFSYRNDAFAPPQFELGQYGTPWLLFDDNANALVISPASHFIIAALAGDGRHMIASGLNDKLPSVPAGFTERTLMAIAPGIRRAWDAWGTALTDLEGKKRPGNESDVALKYYGYWTDNGAAYYYKYEPQLGYAGTLQAVIDQYRKEKLPVRYLQLDSWWYDKSYPGMSTDDPIGRWNAPGGIMRYQADASLFPQGLKAFEQSVGLPLVVHSRWISRFSPYRQSYQISGVAPVGARWWNDIAAYLQSSGGVTYEQDWNSLIDERSPAFSNTINTGEEFYDHMAAACRDHGLTMQYCMALPCDFLEGSKYGNLTSIRVSGDRFSPWRWRDFLYTSQLAYAVGSWPWTDVYDSYETDNLLLGALSAGPVGTGDALGAEDRANILKAVRADGVIVKPDVPITPLDRMYIEDASARKSSFAAMAPGSLGGTARGADSPFIASTWTWDGSVHTAYVFAFSRSGEVYQTVRFSPEEAGSSAPAVVYSYFSRLTRRVERGQDFKASLGPGDAAYYIVAPVGASGIALFGDAGKFVSMGKERIQSLEEGPSSLKVQVLFAPGERSVTLFGNAPTRPRVIVQGGSSGAVKFVKSTGYFSVAVSPRTGLKPIKVEGEWVRRTSVQFIESPGT
jgi:hypothetical protein